MKKRKEEEENKIEKDNKKRNKEEGEKNVEAKDVENEIEKGDKEGSENNEGKGNEMIEKHLGNDVSSANDDGL